MTHTRNRIMNAPRVACTGVIAFVITTSAGAQPNETAMNRSRVLARQAENRRIEVIERIAPAVVCLYDSHERGGGSGVIIDSHGYGLTNYHVVAGMLATDRGLGGLSDGQLYDVEVLGIDPTGDVAMFRLLGRDDCPFASLGDSDTIEIGDTAIAVGNAFTLSEDYTPSVTVGIITGVHRYQYGVGNNLIYSDCIQTDAAINPGNSGGPLFNERGEVIGINGRISVNTRGRFNVGHGYAISSNQIKRFMPSLRAGLLAKHGTMDASVEHRPKFGAVFDRVRPGGAADRAGVQVGDKLLTFDGVVVASANHFASRLGTFPDRWTVQLDVERNGRPLRMEMRLDAVEPKLRQPFAVDRETNLREIRRVLAGYRSAILGDAYASAPARLSWTVHRRQRVDHGDEASSPEEFDATWRSGGSVRLTECGYDGESARILQYDDETATLQFGDQGSPHPIPPVERMIRHAEYVALIALLQPVDELDLDEFAHVGADAAPNADYSQLDPWQRGMMELIEVPVATGAVAEFGFDTGTGRLRRIAVRDVVTGSEAVVYVGDYNVFDGIHLPTRLEVRAPNTEYVDTLSHWAVQP